MKIRLLSALLLLSVSAALGQFGKNKVRYDQFKWQYIQSSHFDIYYSTDSKELAEFAAGESEKAYQSIRETFNWSLQRRYAIIIYNSHNAFQQTNVVSEYMEEGVGGVTELYKNRVVLPFEGSYEDFRHVIHHELTHAFMNDMYYGGSVQSLISGAVKLNIPLWLSEGSSEYESLDWDVQADMFMRDFAFQSRFIPIDNLNGYYAYKGGQSIFRFIHDTYGSQKITEFYANLKSSHSVERCIQKTFNMGPEKFSEDWHTYLKTQYWPEISMAEDVTGISVQLTDHEKQKNYQNIAPAISPSGSRIAYLSDRDGYADIYLMNASDGSENRRLVKGNRQADLEELKWLAPSISWSPDEKSIVFAAKSGKNDALVIVDQKTGHKRFIPIIRLKGIYSAVWHPSKPLIAFEGNDGTQSDLYTYDIDSGKLTNITHDKWRDANPAWSSDGTTLLYSSERMKKDQSDFKHPYQHDIYSINVQDGSRKQYTQTDDNENYPLFSSDGRNIVYTCDENGISNLWIRDLNGNARPVTNILGGIFYPSLSSDNRTLYFSAFQNSGWDIYRINNIFDMPAVTLEATAFKKDSNSSRASTASALSDTNLTIVSVADDSVRKAMETIPSNRDSDGENYRHYVFIPNYSHSLLSQGVAVGDTISMDSTRFMDDSGKYLDHPYKTKFSLDLVDSQLGYSTFYGFQGYSVFLFSDVFGNHQIGLTTELYIDLKNSDYSISYAYLKHRLNVGAGYFNYSDYYYSYLGNNIAITQFRNYGSSLYASYPFNRFTRMDLNETWYVAERNVLDSPVLADMYNSKLGMLINSFSLVSDNVIWSYTAPMDGMRYNLTVDNVPEIDTRNPSFTSLTLDFRKYWKANFDYHFAVRLNAGTSWGKTPQTFMVGGVDNWLNYRYNANAPIFGNSSDGFSEDMNLYYFSRFVTPMRGVPYFEKSGNHFFVMNAEFRYPFIEYAKLRFPLPVTLYQVRGILFTDMGTAWSNKLNLWKNPDFIPIFSSTYDDFMLSSGVGLRIFLGYFLLRIDTAWRYDGRNFSRPQYLFSLGGDF